MLEAGLGIFYRYEGRRRRNSGGAFLLWLKGVQFCDIMRYDKNYKIAEWVDKEEDTVLCLCYGADSVLGNASEICMKY